MDTRLFFMKSLMVLYCGHERESTLTQIWYPPFFGAALWGTGMSYRTSPILGLPWMLFQLPTSFPSVTPGCCEPNPLMPPVAGAQEGKLARPRGTQQCVSWVRGLAPLFLRR